MTENTRTTWSQTYRGMCEIHTWDLAEIPSTCPLPYSLVIACDVVWVEACEGASGWPRRIPTSRIHCINIIELSNCSRVFISLHVWDRIQHLLKSGFMLVCHVTITSGDKKYCASTCFISRIITQHHSRSNKYKVWLCASNNTTNTSPYDQLRNYVLLIYIT
jgi:hypothetical protein